MSLVTVSLGSALNSSQVHETGSSTAPWIVKLHDSSARCGVGPADNTGKSWVTYWPGGTRAASTDICRRPRKPRDNGDIGAPPVMVVVALGRTRGGGRVIPYCS